MIWGWLRQAVDVPDFELLLYYELPHMMKLHLNMFRLRMVDKIHSEVYS